MELTSNEIKKQCNRVRLLRGRALYASKAVEDLMVISEPSKVRKWLEEHNIDDCFMYLPDQDETQNNEEYNIDDFNYHSEKETTDEEDEVTIAEANVIGSTGTVYHVYIVVADQCEDKIIKAHCDCPDYVGGTSFCKHCVAVAHNLVMRQLDKRLADKLVDARELEKKQQTYAANNHTAPTTSTAYHMQDNQGSHSSSAIMQLIKNFSGSAPQEYLLDDTEDYSLQGKVELYPNLCIDHIGRQSIDFKIGTSSGKYVIKDINEFYQHMKKSEYFEYGKNLAFVHDRNNFSQESLYFIDMIEDLRSVQFQKESFLLPTTMRYLPISDGYVEQILKRYEGSEISFQGCMCEVVEQNPKILIKLEKAEAGMYLSMDEYILLKGLTKHFVVNEKERKIYIVSNGFDKYAVPFLDTMKHSVDWQFRSSKKSEGIKCYLSQQDYVSFCGHVLRRIERYVTLDEEEADLMDYMPPQCQVKIYLDAPTEEKMTCRLLGCYGNESYNISDWTKSRWGQFRDFAKEQEVYKKARQYFPLEQREQDDYLLICEREQDMYELLQSGIDELSHLGEMYVSEQIRNMHVNRTPKVTAGVQVQGDLLELSIEIPEMSDEEIGAILRAYHLKHKYYRMKNGDFMQLEETGLGTLAEMSKGLDISSQDWEDGKVTLPLYRANYIDSVMKERGKNMNVVRSSQFKSVIRDMKEVEDSDYEVPKSVNAQLRGYQKTGYRWLRTLAHYGFGGILADDMGLGKTLQVITLLQAVFEEEGYDRTKHTSLIVCPASLVYNWESEFAKFAPEITTSVVVGTAQHRKKMIENMETVDVVITSYDLLKRDLKNYEKSSFLYMIIDEAQYIKNATTQVAKAVKKIKAAHCFALTGTPVENRLSDLWSIFDFVMKGYLYSYEKFRKNYELPIVSEQDDDALNRLQKMVSPFILRRRKKDVLKDLPDKIENVIYTSMTKEQEKYYQARFLKLKRDVTTKSDKEFREDKMKVLAELTRLRQLCCDPHLFIENYKGDSGKVDAFLAMTEELIENGSNILVFSQFATMLSILQEKLEKMEIHTLMLTGKNSKEERREMVEQFQEGEKTVFLISLKAGGTGLNLTAADTVIHFDPWWNVAAQNQATDRAHRIGQDKVVTVIQLVTKHSIEERIIELQNRKKELVDNVVEGRGVENATLSKEEILELLEEL